MIAYICRRKKVCEFNYGKSISKSISTGPASPARDEPRFRTSLSIEPDEKLFKKYDLTTDEIAYIESLIKLME